MEPHAIQIGLTVGALIASGAGAFGGVKVALNGMRATVNRIELKVDKIDDQVQTNRNEISVIRSRCAAFHPEK